MLAPFAPLYATVVILVLTRRAQPALPPQTAQPPRSADVEPAASKVRLFTVRPRHGQR